MPRLQARSVVIQQSGIRLHADLGRSTGPAAGLVLIAHGGGSSRHGPRNPAVAGFL